MRHSKTLFLLTVLFLPSFAFAEEGYLPSPLSNKTDSAGYALHVQAGANALSTQMLEAEMQLGLDFIFPYHLGLSLQGGMAYGVRPINHSFTQQKYLQYLSQQNLDVCFLYRPLQGRHSLTLGVGYSMCFFSSDQLLTEEGYFLRRMDHGIVGRIQYDYRFINNLLLGAYTQYTNYLQYRDTQDKLSFGIVFGWYF